MRYVAFGFFLLFLGMGLAWLSLLQYRSRETTGETIFDVVGAFIPPLRRPMFWVSTIFLGLSALLALIGAAAHFMIALGIG